jgi:hypothetical protein
MEIFKIGLVSDTWTSMVKNRVLRDILTLDRLARKQGVQLSVGSNVDLLPLLSGVVGVTVVGDILNCDTYRVYIDYDNKIASDSDVADPMAVLDRLPEDADYELVELNKGRLLPGLIINDEDPYAAMDHTNPDVEIIPPIIDLDRPPPAWLKNKGWTDELF